MQIYYAILKEGEHIMPIEPEADVSGIEHCTHREGLLTDPFRAGKNHRSPYVETADPLSEYGEASLSSLSPALSQVRNMTPTEAVGAIFWKESVRFTQRARRRVLLSPAVRATRHVSRPRSRRLVSISRYAVTVTVTAPSSVHSTSTVPSGKTRPRTEP